MSTPSKSPSVCFTLPQKFHDFNGKNPELMLKEQAEACSFNSSIIRFLNHFYLSFLESVLAKTADGAFEVFGNFFPRRSGSDAVIGITFHEVIFISTGANVFHNFNLLNF
jgi:hypothetical protein